MQQEQTVCEMVEEVLGNQATIRAGAVLHNT
jgi:hypothetical protein